MPCPNTLSCATNCFPTDQKVRVIFKGFLVTRIHHGDSSAMVGALAPDISTCHQPRIYVLRLHPPSAGNDGNVEVLNLAFDITKDLSLIVSPAPARGIEVFQQDCVVPFNRFDERHADRRDFRWFGNLTEMHGRAVTVNTGKLRPQFILNKGVFHTSQRSDGEALILHPNNSSVRPKPIGKFALEITARVKLEPGSNAELFNNGTSKIQILASDPCNYDIIFDCNCALDDDDLISDFGRLYPLVITDVPGPEQISLVPEPRPLESSALAEEDPGFTPFFSPEVYCTGGNYP